MKHMAHTKVQGLFLSEGAPMTRRFFFRRKTGAISERLRLTKDAALAMI